MRTVGRTAVIAGTASAVSGRVNRRQQQKYAEQEAQQAAPPPPAAAEPAAADSDELINKLKELATLKDQGVLTEEEFSTQKAKILDQLS
jgi:hypothetical protein